MLNADSKDSSQSGWFISATAFSVPTRQGVHWPQLSSSKNRIEIQGHGPQVVLIGKDHDGRRTNEAAIGFQCAEIQRQIAQTRGENSARRAAGQVRLEGVTIGHPATEFVDQFTHRNPGGGEFDAGFLDAARDGETAQTMPAVASFAGQPIRSALDHVPNPVESFDVMDQCRATEQTHLRGKRRFGGADNRACLRGSPTSRSLRRRCTPPPRAAARCAVETPSRRGRARRFRASNSWR